jgi:hypothetical protein
MLVMGMLFNVLAELRVCEFSSQQGQITMSIEQMQTLKAILQIILHCNDLFSLFPGADWVIYHGGN